MPVKRISKFIYTFLPAFLFALYTSAATPALDLNRTRQKAKEALSFSKAKSYSTQYCILIDMSLPSGVKRFVVWDFKKDSVLLSGMVSHGCGRWPWGADWSKGKPEFSNADGSHSTALGKYKLSGRAYSNWGIHVKYFMYGLESTNNKALGRQIVFHSWEKVPEAEVHPNGTPEGWGCPAISNNTMKVVDPLLRKQKKPLLMWIYN
jgi:hypothetical protein